MADTAHPTGKPLRFMAATVVSNEIAFIAAQIVALNAQGVDHTKVFRWKSGAWAHYMIDWPVISLAHTRDPALSIFALDPFGRVHVAQGSHRNVEEIDPGREGPGSRGPMRDLRVIDGRAYAVGMKRQAYRRDQPAVWHRFDAGVAGAIASAEITSFDSIDGFSANDIYAAGLDGQLWHWNGRWTQADSPTSVSLEKVLCVPPATTFVSGQFGTLLRKGDAGWQVIDTGDLKDTLWDLAWFRDRLYATTARGMFVLEEDRLAPLDLGLGAGWTFGNLACNSEVLWSIGRADLALTRDGKSWTAVPCTDDSY